MARTWTEVEQSEQFRSLSGADQEGARQQYFSQVVAPQLSEEDLPLARKQFDRQTRIAKIDLPAGVAPSAAGAGRGSINPPMGEPEAPARRRGSTWNNVKPYSTADERIVAPPPPAPGSSVLDKPAPAGTVVPQPQGLTPQEMTEGSVAPWKLEQDRAKADYLDTRRGPVAKPFDTAQNIAQDVREFTDNPVARGAVAGFSQLGKTGVGAVRMAADLAGADDVAGFAGGASRAADTIGTGATSDLKGNEQLVAAVTSSIMNSAPALAVGTLGGPALTTLFAQSTLAEYNDGRDAGFDVGSSAARAGIMGFAEALGERFGFPEQIKLLKGIARQMPPGEVAKVFGALLMKEIPGEQLTTAMQFLADKAGPAALNPNATVVDYLEAAGETLKVTIGQTAVMGGGPAAVMTGRDATRRADAAVDLSAQTQAQRAAGDAGFIRPIERRKQTFSRFDDLAAEHGLSPKAATAVKQAAERVPLAQLPGFLKRAAQSLSKRGLFGGQVDDAALTILDEPPAASRETDAAPINAAELLGEADFSGLSEPAVQPEGAGDGLRRDDAGPLDGAGVADGGAVPGSADVVRGEQPSEGAAGLAGQPVPGAVSGGAAVPAGAEGGNDALTLVATPLDAKAHEAAASPTNDRPEPTDAQKEAGNYKVGRVRINGLNVSIETPKGAVRRSKADAAEPWEVVMPAHYGYIRGTEGADGDQVDLFIGDQGENGRFWVVNQSYAGKPGTLDEHKVITGVDNADEAVALYKASFANNFGDKVFSSVSSEFDAGEIKARLPSMRKPVPVKRPAPQRDNASAGPVVSERLQSAHTGGVRAGPATSPAAAGRVIARAGRTPTATEDLSLRPNPDGTLTPHLGKEPLLDYDSGQPIKIPGDATGLQAKKAIRDAGAVSKAVNFFPPRGGAPSTEAPASAAETGKPAAAPAQEASAPAKKRVEYPLRANVDPKQREAQKAVVDFMNGDIDKPALIARLRPLGLEEALLGAAVYRLQDDFTAADIRAVMAPANAAAPAQEASAPTPTEDRFPPVDRFDRISIGPGGFIKPRTVAQGQPTYRETDLEGLNDRMREDRQAVPFGGFVADRPELAIGQGMNRGVHIVFRADAVSGREHSKPMTGDLAGREYRTELLAPRAVQTITMAAADVPKLRGLARQRLAAEFDREELDGGFVRFHRKKLERLSPPPPEQPEKPKRTRKPKKPNAQPAPEPEAAEMATTLETNDPLKGGKPMLSIAGEDGISPQTPAQKESKLNRADLADPAQASKTTTYAPDPDPANQRIVEAIAKGLGRPAEYTLSAVAGSDLPGSLRAARALARGIWGHKVVFVQQSGGRLFNGLALDSPGADFVLIDVDTDKPVMAVLGHELTHRLRAARPDIYDELNARLEPLIRDQILYNIRLSDKRERVELVALTDEQLREELIADIVGDEFTNQQFWRDLARTDRSWFRRLAEFVMGFLDDVISKVTKGRPFGTEEYLSDLQAARAAVVDAMAKFAQGESDTTTGGTGDIKLSPADRYTPEQKEALRRAGIGGPSTMATKVKRYFAAAMDMLSRRGELAAAFQQGALDQFTGIKRAVTTEIGNLPAEQDPYIAARLANGGASSVMRAILLHGQAKWNANGQHLEKIDGTKGLLDILAPLGEDLNDFFGWMVGNRAARLMKEGRERNFTADHIKELQGLAKGKEAKFQSAAIQYAAFKRSVLDVAEGAGLIDPVGRKVWDQADYIPFYREIDEKATFSPTGRKGLAGQSSGIRTLKGGEEALNDPMENVLMNFSRLIDASLKNNAIRRTIDTLKTSAVVTKVGYDMTSQVIPASQVRKVLEQAGTPPAVLDIIPTEAFDGMAKMWAIQAPQDPSVVRVMVDGKPQFYKVNDPLLLKALTSFVPFDFPGLGVMRAFKRVLTAAVTSTPDFMIRNFIRDSAASQLIARDGFNPAKSIASVAKAYTEAGGFETMLFAGASFQSGNVNAADPGGTATAVRRALRRKGLDASSANAFVASIVDTPAKLWEKYRHVGEAIENANREAVFEAAKKAGKSDTAAAFESKDLMDFSLRGSSPLYQLLADVLPFFNARVQGLYRAGRADPKRLVSYGMLMMGASLLLAMANDDRDEYDELPDWDKDAYWHFWIGDEHLRLPKPFELGVVFATIPERIFRYAKGQDSGKKFAARMWANVRDQLAFDVVPQAMRPAVNVWANKDTFRDAPIEGMSDEGKLPSHRYTATTSDTARVAVRAVAPAADYVGMSPKRLEYLVGGYFGTVGLYALGLSDIAVRAIEGKPPTPALRLDDYPVVKSFYRMDPPRGTVYESDLYKLREETEQVYRSLMALAREGDAEEAQKMAVENTEKLGVRGVVGDTAKQLSLLSKARSAIYADPKLSPAEKRKQIDELLAKKAELSKLVMQAPAVKAAQ